MKKRGPPAIELDPRAHEVDALQVYVAAQGATAAAWLVNEFRGLVRRAGAFLLHLPRGREMPTWCRVALEFLRQRRSAAGEPRWRVTETKRVMSRDFRVEWLDWPRYSRRGRVAQVVRRAT